MKKMRKETENWWRQAEYDFGSAKDNVKIKRYKVAGFLCQQAAEKALKAVILNKKNELIRTHDLILLAKKAGAPPTILKICKELVSLYIETRYPDTAGKGYVKEEAEEDVNRAEEILKWAKKNL